MKSEKDCTIGIIPPFPLAKIGICSEPIEKSEAGEHIATAIAEVLDTDV